MGRSTTQQYALWTLVIFPKKVQRPMKQTNSTTPGERVHPLPPIEPGPGNNLVLRPVSVTATPRPPAPPPACQPPRPCDREATRRREVTRPTHRGCPAWFGSPFCPVLVSVCVSDLIWFRGGARDWEVKSDGSAAGEGSSRLRLPHQTAPHRRQRWVHSTSQPLFFLSRSTRDLMALGSSFRIMRNLESQLRSGS